MHLRIDVGNEGEGKRLWPKSREDSFHDVVTNIEKNQSSHEFMKIK